MASRVLVAVAAVVIISVAAFLYLSNSQLGITGEAAAKAVQQDQIVVSGKASISGSDVQDPKIIFTKTEDRSAYTAEISSDRYEISLPNGNSYLVRLTWRSSSAKEVNCDVGGFDLIPLESGKSYDWAC